MTVVTRFAPSPTGRLHLGHALSAVLAHDLARRAGGRFLVRIEDIDGARSRPEHVAGIVEDLGWLGLAHDGPLLFQSRRLDRYAAALDRLRALGLVYACSCTRAEIAASASAPHGEEPPPYPGTCRLGARGKGPFAWRLDMAAALERAAAAAPLRWHDRDAGDVVADPARFGDVVLARKDAPSSYHLSVTVDDAAQGVTDVIRGRDLFGATHVHRLLQALLDLPTPEYRHHPLIMGSDGRRLAKRDQAPTLAAMRAVGVDGRRLAVDLARGVLPPGYALMREDAGSGDAVAP